MTDHNPLPRCPYCGGEMTHRYVCGDNFYLCDTCHSSSPEKGAREAAYEAAMNRWQEPNRVLTMEEATEQRAAWVEDFYCGIAPAVVFDSVSNHYSIINNAWFEKTEYGKHWRCWLRKPTAAEMATTPWESKREG